MGLLDDIKNWGTKLEDGIADVVSLTPVGATYYLATGQDNPGIAAINSIGDSIPAVHNIQQDVKAGFEIGTGVVVIGAGLLLYVLYENKSRIGNAAASAVIPGLRPF